jgi:putative hydrolase of the HAD superfamily
MTVRAVAFDLDYTLAVPTSDRETILEESTRAVGAPSVSRQAYLDAHASHLTRETRAPIFERLLEESGGRQAATVDPERWARAYRERVASALEPVPGVEGLVAGLREEYRVGLLTNGPTVAQRDKLATLGWTDMFDATLVTGELPAGKPDPAAFEALLDALGTTPEETVYVGDDVEADVAGAAAAGIIPVQVRCPEGYPPDPRAAAHVDRDRLVAELPGVVRSL